MGGNGMDRDAKRAMEPKLATGQNKRSRLMKLAHRLFHPGERLSQRVIHAGFWAFALRITDWFVRSSAGSSASPGLGRSCGRPGSGGGRASEHESDGSRETVFRTHLPNLLWQEEPRDLKGLYGSGDHGAFDFRFVNNFLTFGASLLARLLG